MIIAIDHDRTYTKAPALWEAFAKSAIADGHTVITLTKRYPEESVNLPWTVHYTSRMAKAKYAASHNLQIDIWVDDDPM